MPLHVVATPIGNLGDITLRAIETLKSADLVASEDTRRTGRLLSHLGIAKPQVAFFEHNEERAARRILEALAAGKEVALVTSAGTPGISDPGFTLVRDALAAGHAVTMAPGASALVMAVVLSGLPVHSFTFKGFPPRKKRRRAFFEADRDSPHTLVFYEAPHRLGRFLADALAAYGDRRAALCFELTKMFERVERGTLAEFFSRYGAADIRGEVVAVIAGKSDAADGLDLAED
jgi:16S rRNA (cytidine1402-2'-O)-methyltransferase